MLRLLGLGRRRRRLGAIGLDHHQAGAFQQLPWIDARRLRRIEPRLLDPRLLGASRLLAGRLRPTLFGTMLRLMLLHALFGYGWLFEAWGGGCGRRQRGLRVMLFAAQA
jgi:hypothetical protein